MQRRPRIAVVGTGCYSAATYSKGREVGRLLAESGFDIVCGGLGGVMQAACEGAKSAGGHTMGILPGDAPDAANTFVDTAVVTGLGNMRNALVVANGIAVIAVEGEAGTLSELALALKSGKLVVAIGKWAALDGVHPAETPKEAVAIIEQLAFS